MRQKVAIIGAGGQARYAYDGQGYREIIRRYPQSKEAETARHHLENLEPHLAKEK